VLLMFACGMALALWRGAGGMAPPWLRLGALLALAVLGGPLRLPLSDAGPWDHLASRLAATHAAASLFPVRVERPMTAGLNRRAGSPHEHHLTV
jgi:hypothetical protein